MKESPSRIHHSMMHGSVRGRLQHCLCLDLLYWLRRLRWLWLCCDGRTEATPEQWQSATGHAASWSHCVSESAPRPSSTVSGRNHVRLRHRVRQRRMHAGGAEESLSLSSPPWLERSRHRDGVHKQQGESMIPVVTTHKTLLKVGRDDVCMNRAA